MTNYRYDLISADIDFGIKEHPQTQMKKLGFHVVKSEPVPIADCWWFRVDNEIENVPSYLTMLADDMKFSDELICTNCKFRLDLEKLDYSQGGCQHTKLDGFCCLAFASEGQANWMVGLNPDEGMCECFSPKE